MKAGIDVYASQGTIEARGFTGHRIKAVEALKQFTVGSWTVLPFDTQHDAIEPLGFLLQNAVGDRLLFATDTMYVKYRFHQINYLMIECNYDESLLNENVLNGDIHPAMKRRIRRSHFSLDNVKGFLRANDLSGIREIHLLHLSEQNSSAEKFKKEIQRLTGKPVIVAGE